MYTLTAGDQVDEHETRAAAIAAAKEISSEQRGKVELEDDSGREFLTYQNGQLLYYVYETRPRRRSPRD